MLISRALERASFWCVYMWFCVTVSSGGGSDILWSEKNTFFQPLWFCLACRASRSGAENVKHKRRQAPAQPFSELQCHNNAISRMYIRCVQHNVLLHRKRKGSIRNYLNHVMKTPAEQQITSIWIPSISTQQNNKTGELIGSYLLNMNLGTWWCCTDVINRLL